ncbi:hypothetical protein AX14_003747 [Amanita brunnescens Koide BX004]|nr:hypothetical protein AX14_003747 [Amanita brunnescens Koide BX004]
MNWAISHSVAHSPANFRGLSASATTTGTVQADIRHISKQYFLWDVPYTSYDVSFAYVHRLVNLVRSGW